MAISTGSLTITPSTPRSESRSAAWTSPDRSTTRPSPASPRQVTPEIAPGGPAALDAAARRSPIDSSHENGYRPSVRLRGGRRLRARTNVTSTGAEGGKDGGATRFS